MVGADPNFHTCDLAGLVKQPGVCGGGRWRSLAVACVVVPLSLTLAHCSRAPGAAALAANVQSRRNASKNGSRRRGSGTAPTPSESLTYTQYVRLRTRTRRTGRARLLPRRLTRSGSTLQRATLKEDLTTLVSINPRPSPITATIPRRKRRSSTSQRAIAAATAATRAGLLAGRDLRQPRAAAYSGEFRRPQTRRDRRVLPRQRRDAGARCARPPIGAAADQQIWRQCGAAGAATRSRCLQFLGRQVLGAGRLQALHRQVRPQLARLYGDPGAAKAFAKMPIIIVGYSGGFLPTAWSSRSAAWW